MKKERNHRRSSAKGRNFIERLKDIFGERRILAKHSKALIRMYEQEDDSMTQMIESTKRLSSTHAH